MGVVMVTHNSEEHAPVGLSRLPLGRLAGAVVVDHESSDGTAEAVTALELPGVRVIHAANRGFGAGCNRGMAELPEVRLLLLLNPDAVLVEEDLLTLVRYLDDHPAAALVAPRLFKGGEALTSAGRVATAWTELRYALPNRLGRWVPERRLPPAYDRSGRVGVVEGACMLVDRAALASIGGFDERYFLFYEEHDLARRLEVVGRETHLCAEARAEHAVGASRAALPWEGRDHYWRSCVRYLRRWSRPGGAALVATAVRSMLLLAWVRRRASWTDVRRLSAAVSLRGLSD